MDIVSGIVHSSCVKAICLLQSAKGPEVRAYLSTPIGGSFIVRFLANFTSWQGLYYTDYKVESLVTVKVTLKLGSSLPMTKGLH